MTFHIRNTVAATLIAAAAMTAPATTALAGQAEEQALAEDVIAMSGTKTIFNQMIQQLMPLMIKSVRADVPNLSNQAAQVIQDELQIAFDEVSDEYEAEMAKAYVDMFTENELQTMHDFFSSPTGQKMQSKQPELMQRGQQVGQRLGMQAGQNAVQRAQQRIEAEGIPLRAN